MHKITTFALTTLALTLGALVACDGEGLEAGISDPGTKNTCTGTWPSYWQDPEPRFKAQWEGQSISNQPPKGWSGPVFRLSDAFPKRPVDHAAAQPWRDSKFDVLFTKGTSTGDKTALAEEYSWLVMTYLQDGNIDNDMEVEDDWDLCENTTRPWFHMPFQTYDGLTGRDFTHGLTREAPVTFNLNNSEHPGSDLTLASTMWAVGFYNATAAYTLGTIWKSDGTVAIPTKSISFEEGAVVGKLLFNTDSPQQFSSLANMPSWTANISNPGYCTCTPAKGESSCSLAEESLQCGRSTSAFGPVTLLQFDIAVKDSRAPGTGWVFGTFVADGQRKASEPNPWNRISPLGLMWGNATPPRGQVAAAYPADPRKDGFKDIVIFWDVVNMLNEAGGSVAAQAPGHLGCNSRLNGPADNANSACMSCHGTASVPDRNMTTPPIVTQFSGGSVTSECVTPTTGETNTGTDASGSSASVINDVSFTQVDSLWFADTGAGVPFNATLQTESGPKNVLDGQPAYADGNTSWVSTDYSLQLSGALGSWMQWQHHAAEIDVDSSESAATKRVWTARLPRRGMKR